MIIMRNQFLWEIRLNLSMRRMLRNRIKVLSLQILYKNNQRNKNKYNYQSNNNNNKNNLYN
jgi:hypothetical protein